jgi:hypothetical protein
MLKCFTGRFCLSVTFQIELMMIYISSIPLIVSLIEAGYLLFLNRRNLEAKTDKRELYKVKALAGIVHQVLAIKLPILQSHS